MNEPALDESEVRRARYTIYVNAISCAGWVVINVFAAWLLGKPRLLGLAGAALAMNVSWAVALRDLSSGRVQRGVLNYVVSGLLLLWVMGLSVPEMSVLFVFATFIFLSFGLSYAGQSSMKVIVALTLLVAGAMLFTSQVLQWNSGVNPDLLRWVNAVGMTMALAINATSFLGLRKTLQARGDRVARAEQRYRMLLENAPDAIGVLSEAGVILEANRLWERMIGLPKERFLGHPVDEFTSSSAAAGPGTAPLTTIVHADGQVGYFEVNRTSVDVSGERLVLGVGRDVTERLKLEGQLRQGQKMEAVGRLAGGIAHDFNNILSVILLQCEFLLADLDPKSAMREQVEEISQAAKRAADLTRQLLAFSRQQVVEPRVLDLNDVLASMNKMLRRIVGEDIELRTVHAPGLGLAKVDPSGLEQVIMNLVVNARDAMPRGGKLTLETANVLLDEAYVATHIGAKVGPHVMLAVADNGVGMDKATQARVFEPFFTTKERGKGTGLGLATVLGIAQQNGGSIWVYSEPNRGSTFKLYLPRVDAAVDPRASPVVARAAGGTETVLVVDDDAPVRAATCEILRRLGYRVLEARDTVEALRLGEQQQETIHLLVTDVVMPQMSGPELASKLTRLRPALKVICMSGYTDDSVVRHGVMESEIAFLQKPISSAGLAQKVREVLDRS